VSTLPKACIESIPARQVKHWPG